MGKTGNPAEFAGPDRRKHRRYDLDYPVHVIYRSRDAVAHLDAVSKDASIDGMLLEAASSMPMLSTVSFVIMLKGGPLSRSIELLGEGKVVRVDSVRPEAGYTIAIECTRPIAQIEDYYPSAG